MYSRDHLLSRQELYQLVWTEPMTVVAKRLGMSDRGLAKACHRASVPVPERGYWAKRQAGKPVLKASLPPRGLGVSDLTDVRVEVPETSSVADEPEPVPPVFDEDLVPITERVRAMVGKVSIPKNLTKAHPAIRRLLEKDEERRQKQLNSPYPLSWYQPRYDSPIERRRLRILNALFLVLARCHARPAASERDDGLECTVRVGDQWVHFDLEPIKGRSRPRIGDGSKAKAPPERLRLTIQSWGRGQEHYASWEDSEEGSLEGMLDEMTVALIVAGEAKYRELLQHRYECDLRERQRRIEEERQRKEEEERRERERIRAEQQARTDRLLGEAAALRQAADIRAYVKSVLANHELENTESAREKLQSWAKWALAEADRIDPIKSGRFLRWFNSSLSRPASVQES